MTTIETRHAPLDNLVRALVTDNAVSLRSTGDGEDGRTLFGHFAVFNRWTEIDSLWEGRFLERIVPGAFNRTFSERRDQIKVLYDHGRDPQLGNKPLGPIESLSEDSIGAAYEVRLIEASYNDDFVIPAVREGLLGASFRFHVAAEEWVEPRNATKTNPAKLPERTLTDLDVYEFGPVTFPAYADATAGVRSGTDEFFDRLHDDPVFLARFTERAGLSVVERLLEVEPLSARTEQDDDDTTDDSTDGQKSAPTYAERQQVARRIEASRKGVGKA